MDTQDHSPEISQLLAAERDIRRSLRYRLFGTFAGTPLGSRQAASYWLAD